MVASVSFGRVAQLVEHLTFNQVAPGSNPGALTKLKRRGFPPFFITNDFTAFPPFFIAGVFAARAVFYYREFRRPRRFYKSTAFAQPRLNVVNFMLLCFKIIIRHSLISEGNMKTALSLLAVAAAILAWWFYPANSWDKTFPESDKVTVKKVKFKNRYGIELVGDLYAPKNKTAEKLPAIAVSGPFGAVKEQSSGLYAQKMAEKGFIALAFDPSYTGESGGEPRLVASPDINTEDMSAAVDFLSVQDDVDADKIGMIGICGFGGFALNAAAMDTRVKATVTSTMYDMSRVNANGYFDAMNKEDRYRLKQKLNAQRTEDFKNGTYAAEAGLPDKLTGDEPQFVKDYYDYYKTPRGYHKRSKNSNTGWNMTSSLSFINMPILTYSNEIKSAVLMIHGEKAHSRYFSEDAYKKLVGDNKELMIIPNASHTDLYDKTDIIPFDKIAQFFRDNLK